MSTTTGAIAGLLIGVVVGIGGALVLGMNGAMDTHGMDMHGMNMATPMDGDMGGMPMTGDPDHDFMAGMVPHHESAVEMAQVVLRTTEDPDVRALAENILATQQTEIDQMNVWLAANPQ